MAEHTRYLYYHTFSHYYPSEVSSVSSGQIDSVDILTAVTKSSGWTGLASPVFVLSESLSGLSLFYCVVVKLSVTWVCERCCIKKRCLLS